MNLWAEDRTGTLDAKKTQKKPQINKQNIPKQNTTSQINFFFFFTENRGYIHPF